MSRFDSRTKDTFKKDIKFGTMMEAYWWNRWFAEAMSRKDIVIVRPRDNGCGNDGEFIESGNTAGADYMADIAYDGRNVGNCPVEVKWVPTAGKFTLKENDLRAYVREKASILFIYNSVRCGTDLRKPKDYNFDRHVKLIESKNDQMRWGFMWFDKVAELYSQAKKTGSFKPVRYMGNKNALILPDNDFKLWFKEEKWNV